MKYLVVLFCLFSTLSFAQRGKNQVSSLEQSSTLTKPTAQGSDADQVLQIILSDFASALVVNGGSKIIILDSYNDLVNKRYTFNDINFIAGGKTEVTNNNGVMLAFWRMDISTNKAHIEFYYTDSKAHTTHHEYLLTKENAVWRK
jgi:hypothetical protein